MACRQETDVFTEGQKWWLEERFPEIERQANALLDSYEGQHGKLEGCVIRTELLLETIGCSLYYFADEEREEHHIPHNALGVLKPDQRLVLVYSGIGDVGRENQTIGEEIGHFVLHRKTAQRTQSPGNGSTGKVFHRTEQSGFLDGQEEPIWMSREASFFGACLQMPRDRYGKVAKEQLARALFTRPNWSPHWRTLAEKTRQVESFLGRDANRCLSGDVALRRAESLFDTPIVESALKHMKRMHEGLASRPAQRRRLIELGLAIDAADIVKACLRVRDARRWEHFLLCDEVREGVPT